MSEILIQKAVRKKLRFTTLKGEVSVEDLFDLTLADLNEVAKHYNREVKEVEEEDFLKETSVANTDVLLRFNIAVYVLNIKKQEKEDQIKSLENKEAKDKLLSALSRKQDRAMEEMSEAEIQEAIAKL